MNTVRPVPFSSEQRRPAAIERPVAVPAARRKHRDRDFGVGYGSSSGYASGKRYSLVWKQPHFRFA